MSINNSKEGDHVHGWAVIGRVLERSGEWLGDFHPMSFEITYLCGDVNRPGASFEVKNYTLNDEECVRLEYPLGTVYHRRFIMRLMDRDTDKPLTDWSEHFAYWDVWDIHAKLVESVK